jgi:hypothetical protein
MLGTHRKLLNKQAWQLEPNDVHTVKMRGLSNNQGWKERIHQLIAYVSSMLTSAKSKHCPIRQPFSGRGVPVGKVPYVGCCKENVLMRKTTLFEGPGKK